MTDIGDGTVRDNNTGLLWLKNANCFGSMTWQNASTAVDALNSGECGLTDGSASGDWRLPTINEWDSFIDDSYEDPSLSNAAGSGKWVEGDSFNEVISWYYWSATEYDVDNAYIKSMYDGITLAMSKTDVNDVWPVRDEN